MKSLIVYESMFGDTRQIAEAIASGLAANSAANHVDVVEVGAAPTAIGADVDLLVVGGPTHAFSMSRPSSRKDAGNIAGDRAIISQRRGIREWLEMVILPEGLAAASFDTKVSKPHLPGSAGRAAQKRLHRKGCRIIANTENFYVADTRGPLNDGEEVRARSWGADLESLISDSSSLVAPRHAAEPNDLP